MALLNRTIPAEGYGLLNAIAGPESGGNYGVIYGGKQFNDYSHHPHLNIPIENGPNKGKTSSAAGRYQFLGDTWDDISGRYGLPDFSPQNQDLGAWALANEVYRNKTGGDLTEALRAGKLQDVAKTLSGTWTSLAGGIEPQAAGTGRGLMANYQAGVEGRPVMPGAAPVLASNFDQPGFASQANAQPTQTAQAEEADVPEYNSEAIKGLLASLNQPEEAQQIEPMKLNAAEAPLPPRRPAGLAFKISSIKPRRMGRA